MKVAYRTGILLKQFPELTSLHEQEMYEYLYEDGNYGTREGQFSTFEKFRDFVTLQMEQLRAANKFSANELINLRGAQRLSLSMQTYNKLMRALTEKKRLIQKQVTDRMRSLNASILNKTSTPSLFDEPIDDKLLEY